MNGGGRSASESALPRLEPRREEGHRLGPAVDTTSEHSLDTPFGDVVAHPGTMERVRTTLGTAGQPLDPITRALMESRFGTDLAQVRVHTDADAAESASAVHAHAYTVGQHVVFGRSRYAPATASGRTLLAHEIAHTIQQRGGGAAASSDDHQSDDHQGSHETSARAAAQQVGAGQQAQVVQPGAAVGISRSPDDEHQDEDVAADVEAEVEAEEKEEPVVRSIGEIATTSSLIRRDPRWARLDRLAEQVQRSDPEWGAYATERDTQERSRRIKQEVNDEMRTERFESLRRFLEQRHPHRDDLAPWLGKHYTMRDLQILRAHGFTWGTRSEGSTRFEQSLMRAIDKYLANQKAQQFGGAASMREWTQADEDALVKKRQQEANIKAWLEGVPHVTGSVLGGGSAWIASLFTDDPQKITAAAKFGTALSGTISPLAERMANRGTYSPEAEVPYSAPGGPRYSGRQSTKPADTKARVKPTPGTPPAEPTQPPAPSVTPPTTALEPQPTTKPATPETQPTANTPGSPSAPTVAAAKVPTVSRARVSAAAADRMARAAAEVKTKADDAVARAQTALDDAQKVLSSLPPVTEPVPSAASRKKLPAAEANRRQAQRRIDSAQKALRKAEAVAESATQSHTTAHEVARNRQETLSQAQDRAAQKAAATAAGGEPEKPRWTPGMGGYSPKDHRRPDLSHMTEPPSAIDRHSGERTNPDARVSIYHEALPQRVAPPKGATPQEVGHDAERALREDVLAGSKYRETHQAGDKTRHGDIGAYEVKAKTQLSSADLDQIWRDLLNPGRNHTAHITMPSIGDKSAKALARMAATFEKLTGKRPTIVVREYAPTAPGATP